MDLENEIIVSVVILYAIIIHLSPCITSNPRDGNEDVLALAFGQSNSGRTTQKTNETEADLQRLVNEIIADVAGSRNTSPSNTTGFAISKAR